MYVAYMIQSIWCIVKSTSIGTRASANITIMLTCQNLSGNLHIMWHARHAYHFSVSTVSTMSGPEAHSTKGLRAHNWNLMQIIIVVIMIMIIQSGHNFAHVTTAQLLWHVQKLWPDWIIIFKVRTACIFTRFGIWAHTHFMKWLWCHQQGQQWQDQY